MGLVLLLLFITVPLVEIAVFIQVGDWIGLWPTLALILLTAILGTWQLRLQGMATLARARQQLDRGEVPAAELFNGLCLLVAGALLLTPGFVTDAAGASLFLPPVRGWLRRRFGRHLEARARGAGASGARTRVFVNGEEVQPGAAADPRADPRSRWGRGRPFAPGTIEGEWQELDPEPGAGQGDADAAGRLPGSHAPGDEPGSGEATKGPPEDVRGDDTLDDSGDGPRR
ncbi:MAG: FxsA family protein [Tistlia sp.]|uniref:FxsA family protein n=1 Tax=Tistlia sp. TaxID=3057121 RepID=UPI0034A5CEF2